MDEQGERHQKWVGWGGVRGGAGGGGIQNSMWTASYVGEVGGCTRGFGREVGVGYIKDTFDVSLITVLYIISFVVQQLFLKR